MKLLRKILFPIVPIYYLVTWLRNWLYDKGWKTSKSYEFPIICVGNLSTGGTGKTPTIEYLIRLLKQHYKVATLSRGYKRESTGFLIGSPEFSAKILGDEPFQFYKKFDDITVSVGADRQHGIEQLMNKIKPDVILLDDAFQHRKVKAGFNILLTSFDNLFYDDVVLPTGNLREPRAGARRADVILVTKCPLTLSASEKTKIIKNLKLLKHQDVYFSVITYSEVIRNATEKIELQQLKGKRISLVTGIANPEPLVTYLKSKAIDFEHLKYKDHHVFSTSEIEVLKKKEVILTTEKDYVRLVDNFKDRNSQLYYLPISFQIDKAKVLNERIRNFVDSF
ncbi:tetraacyldisaccharide 4'-kinase [Psychroserpens sp.]|uniref:tetraacyldisaccharide 4'-kinase n=1 Tax=Psychroserpens sp. TaxID=2020870 RepID=UPI003C77CB11